MSGYVPENMKKVDSTSISAYAYESGDLYVQYKAKGSIYIYKDVPQHVFDELENAISKGSFIANFIKNNYNYDYLC